MSVNRMQRYNYRRRRPIGCGCLAALAGFVALIGLGVVLLLPVLPTIGLRLIGFSPVGETDTVFEGVVPAPAISLDGGIRQGQATVNLGSYGNYRLSGDSAAYSIVVGGQTAVAIFSESGLLDLCRQLSAVCGTNSGPYRNLRVDLRPGGAVIYADVTISELGLSQTVGMVAVVDDSGRQFTVAGVDMGGVLYSVPPNSLGDLVADFERVGNDLLRQLTLDAGGGRYDLSEIRVSDNELTLILRS